MTDMQRLREALADEIVDAITVSRRGYYQDVSEYDAAKDAANRVLAVLAEEGWVAPEEVAALRSCALRMARGWAPVLKALDPSWENHWARNHAPAGGSTFEPMTEPEIAAMQGVMGR